MGQNKAFLMLDGRTMLEIVASAVHQAAGNVTIVGSPEVYGHFGWPVIPDTMPGAGPLGGIATALSQTAADWNLMVACDMPRVTSVLLGRILAEAEAHSASCILPQGDGGLVEPLCAAYHKSMLPLVSQALSRGIRKVTDALPRESIHYLRIADPGFQNINTPDEWRRATEPR